MVSIILPLWPVYDLGADLSLPSFSWWPTITCAFLDGVVSTDEEKTSLGRDTVMTVPFLTGRELRADCNRVRYIREGTLADMHPGLLSFTGQRVRVLRGNLLHSDFAPTAGVRNDGL